MSGDIQCDATKREFADQIALARRGESVGCPLLTISWHYKLLLIEDPRHYHHVPLNSVYYSMT